MRILGLFLIALGFVLAVVGGIGAGLVVADLNRGGAKVPVAIVLGVVMVVGISLIGLGIVTMRKGKPIGATGASDDTTGLYPANKEQHYELDGTPYTTHYTPPVKGKHAKPSVLTISTPVDCTCEFQMVVETWWDKLCKQWGIAVEIETGDQKFDDECYIRTDTPAFTEAYLSDPLKRVAILDLRQFGFLQVTLAHGKLTATRTGFHPPTDHRDDFAADVAARLVLLSRNLPEHRPEFDERTGEHRKMWQAFLWTGLLLFAATALALFAYPPIHTTQLLWRAAVVLALGWPLFAYASAQLLAGTSRSHIVWGGLLSGSLFLFPLGSAGGVALLNGGLDNSPEETREAQVVAKYTSKSKNSTNYHVRIAAWDRPGGTISFGVSAAEYDKVVMGRSKMVVVTRNGALGVEWLKSNALIP